MLIYHVFLILLIGFLTVPDIMLLLTMVNNVRNVK